MLAGLEQISAGDIRFGERRVNDLPPKDRDIAMVFENYALYPHKTVFENIANPLRLRGIDARDDRAQGRARPPKLLEIGHLLRPQAGASSAAARSSGSPSAGPSCASRSCSCSTSRSPISTPSCAPTCAASSSILQRELGTTMIYVTHDQLEALSMADRIAVMHDGVLQQLGTPRRDLRPSRSTNGSPASSASRR